MLATAGGSTALYLLWGGPPRRLDLSGAVEPRLKLRQLGCALLLHLMQMRLPSCWCRVQTAASCNVAYIHALHDAVVDDLPAQQPQLKAGTRSAICNARSVAHHIRGAYQLAVPDADVDADLQRRRVHERLVLPRERCQRLRLQAQQEVDAAGEHVAGVQPLQRSSSMP
jgi:hypothetical protein